MRIRSQLLALVVALVVPITLLAGATLVQLQSVQRHEQEQRLRERVGALRLVLDAQTETGLRALAGLAERPAGNGLRQQEAAQLFASHPLWQAIGFAPLRDGEGWSVTRDPSGPAAAPPPDFVERVAAQGDGVSGLVAAADGAKLTFLAVALQRDGVAAGALFATVRDSDWLAFLRRFDVSDPGTITLNDRAGRVVARTLDHDDWVGRDALPHWREATEGIDDGALNGRGLDGSPYFASFSRLRSSGWVLGSGVPVSILDATVRKATLVTVVSLSAATIAALLLAAVISNRLASAMTGLLEMASGIAEGEPARQPTPLALVDAETVRQKAQEAAEARRARDEAQARALASETRARAIAEAASRAKDEYIAMLGHELRNPLSAIASAGALLASDRAADGERRQAVRVLERQVRHLRKMVDDLLDATRLASGKLELDRRPVELGAVVRQVVEHFVAAGRGGQLRIEIDAVPVWILGDEVRIEQVVANLLDNACKYTPDGGRVRLRVAADGDCALLRVEDSGAGLEPELLPRVFEAFTQGPRPIDRSQGGVGLGLAIVHQLVVLHGGSVTAENGGELGGAVFTVRLARAAEPASPAQPPAVPRSVPLRVLIVEDNADSREMLAALLELDGHRVSTAADGVAGLAALQAETPDVALVDLGLPGLDGHALARRAREAGVTRTRLFALTGYDTEREREAAARAGFDGFLVKPLEHGAFQALLVEHALA